MPHGCRQDVEKAVSDSFFLHPNGVRLEFVEDLQCRGHVVDDGVGVLADLLLHLQSKERHNPDQNGNAQQCTGDLETDGAVQASHRYSIGCRAGAFTHDASRRYPREDSERPFRGLNALRLGAPLARSARGAHTGERTSSPPKVGQDPSRSRILETGLQNRVSMTGPRCHDSKAP